jgi:hypothetical protein
MQKEIEGEFFSYLRICPCKISFCKVVFLLSTYSTRNESSNTLPAANHIRSRINWTLVQPKNDWKRPASKGLDKSGREHNFDLKITFGRIDKKLKIKLIYSGSFCVKKLYIIWKCNVLPKLIIVVIIVSACFSYYNQGCHQSFEWGFRLSSWIKWGIKWEKSGIENFVTKST